MSDDSRMTKPRSLDLYPPPGKPSSPPTWEDVERLARNYPVAHHAVTMVQRGDWTREQALVALVYALADAYSQMFRAEVERLNMEIPNRIVLPGDQG